MSPPLLRRVDARLYAAKASGRDTVRAGDAEAGPEAPGERAPVAVRRLTRTVRDPVGR